MPSHVVYCMITACQSPVLPQDYSRPCGTVQPTQHPWLLGALERHVPCCVLVDVFPDLQWRMHCWFTGLAKWSRAVR